MAFLSFVMLIWIYFYIYLDSKDISTNLHAKYYIGFFAGPFALFYTICEIRWFVAFPNTIDFNYDERRVKIGDEKIIHFTNIENTGIDKKLYYSEFYVDLKDGSSYRIKGRFALNGDLKSISNFDYSK